MWKSFKGAYMQTDWDATYFNPKDVLECGQIFRFTPFREGYFVISRDKACYLHTDGIRTYVECEPEDTDYFYGFYDLSRSYADIVQRAQSYGIPLLSKAAQECRGLRLLNQDREEMIYSFIVSQNNNIPRIKGIISRICEGLGEKREFMGETYYTFPSSAKLAAAGAPYYKSLGCGYRDTYLAEVSAKISQEGISHLDGLDALSLKKELMKYKGIGGKVADCIALFGFSQRSSFPVDTWIEKAYREDFHGTLKSRDEITKYFMDLFGEDAGYMQQYIFYGKREGL